MSDEISLIPSLGISASALDAETRRMEVIAGNIANANTTVGEDGKVFRKKQVIFAEKLQGALNETGPSRLSGVEVKGIKEDTRAPKMVYRPGHPDADSDGFVKMPDINPVEEMVDMMSSVRSYEANLAAIRAARRMAEQALSIGGK